MALKSSKIIQQKKIQPNTVLLESDEPVKLLLILHEGLVWAVNEKSGPKQQHFLYELPKNSIIGFASLLSQAPCPVSYISQTPALISAFPVTGAFQSLIMGKLNLGFMAARSLLQEVYGSYQTFSKLSQLRGLAQKLQDNTALAYRCCLPNLFNNNQNKQDADPVLQAARATSKAFERNGMKYPSTPTQAWLQADHSSAIGRNYRLSSQFDLNAFQLYRKILALPMDLQSSIYKTDISILEQISIQLKQMLHQNIRELYAVQVNIELEMAKLLDGDNSYAEKLSLLQKGKNSELIKFSEGTIHTIISFFHQSCQIILRQYQILQKNSYQKGSQELAKLGQSISKPQKSTALSNPPAKQNLSPSYAKADGESISRSLAGSAAKIMSMTGTPAQEAKKVLEILKKLKSLSSPLDSSQDARRLRRELSTLYWKIWGKAYQIYREKQTKTAREIQMMIHFGFFDEELLDASHLSFIYSQNTKEEPTHYPIVNVQEWMEKIYAKEENPSLNELGQGYFEKLKEAHRDAGWKRESDVPAEIDTSQKRLVYETQTFLENNVRLTSGTPTTCLPMLNRDQLTLPIDKAFLSKKIIQEKIESLIEIDYSAFYREVILNDEKLGITKEFIQRQVYPYFIVVPSAGTKIMMWQEIAGRNKSSPGRIVLPIFATTDLQPLLIQAIAAFRWELTKTIMGTDWNNVGQPSLTADYTDYVQFYKKNRDLSPEVKEKLNIEFKRFRSDRDRFANDYLSWIQYESQGVMRLNKVTRSILYRHVPFHKKIRDQICEQPAFTEFHNRFRNIRIKKLRELENRYRKFGEKSGTSTAKQH